MSGPPDSPLVLSELGVTGFGWESPRVSAQLERGQLLLVTGPIGSGKTLLAEALAGVKHPGFTMTGAAHWGQAALDTRDHGVAFAPSDARLAVLPTDTVGSTLMEIVRQGSGAGGAAARAAATRHLVQVGLSDASRVWGLQFRELSSGERRRATWALALARRPRLLVVDDPFGSLDERGRSAVLRALRDYLTGGGRVVAWDRTAEPLIALATVHRLLGEARPGSMPAPQDFPPLPKPSERTPSRGSLLRLERVGTVRGRSGWLRRTRRVLALDGATLRVERGQIVALVGENGSGKTSLLELVAGLLPVTFGEVSFAGEDLTRASDRRKRRARRYMQLVSQEAATALAPHKTVRELLSEPLSRVPSDTDDAEASRFIARLGLASALLDRRADQLSVGEAQRVDVLRSLAARPKLLLLDTPRIAGLGDSADVGSLQALLAAARASGVAVLLAEPTILRVRHIADSVAILLSGRVVEVGPPEQLVSAPLHPYTSAFVKRSLEAGSQPRPSEPPPSGAPSSAPRSSDDSLLDRQRRRLRWALESAALDPRSPSRACPYVTRCPREIDRCRTEEPPLVEVPPGSGRHVACFRPT